MSNKSDTEVSVKEAYENAASLLESGEIDLAEYQLSEILKKFPDEPNALRLSGLSSPVSYTHLTLPTILRV